MINLQHTLLDRTPYTYLIGWSKLNKWYYGVRYAKNCHPNDLWIKYFTSSKKVKEFRKTNGEPDIIEVRKIFNDKLSAKLWEEKVLQKLNVVNNDNWLNCISKGFKGIVEFDKEKQIKKLKKYWTDERKKEHSLKFMGRKSTIGYTNEFRLKNGFKLLPGKPKGSKHKDIYKKQRSEKLKGKPVHKNFTTKGLKLKHSEETKLKIKLSTLKRKVYHCDICHKNIKGTMNWDRHIKSKIHLSQIL